MTVLKSLAPLALALVLFAPAALDRSTTPDTADDRPTSAAEVWKVDPGHSNVLFRIQHLGAANFWGRFNKVTGRFRFDAESPEKSFVEIEVPTKSIDTNDPGRDTHMKAQDFFAAKEFPKLTFKSTKVVAKKKGLFDVTGELVLRGKKKTISFEVRHIGTAEVNAKFGRRSGYETSFDIKRSDFGMDTYLKEKLLGDEVRILVSLEGMLSR